jgi:anaerobic magnesium-protoporphyrin IX monomethyl ester cyclase
MKIRLFVPPGGYFAERWSKGSTMPTLGLLSIGAVLEKEGIDVGIVPSDVLGLGWKDIEKRIRTEEPDIIGITGTTENRFQAFRLIRLARKVRPEALIIMGGPHASMAAEDTLSHIRELDIVVRGEGELTTLEICRAYEKIGMERTCLRRNLAAIDGITFRGDGEIVSTPARAPIADLDTLPFPAFHLVPFGKYNFKIEVPGHGLLQAVNIMASRGCPFDCNFCATPINWGRHVRMRSPENIVREIEEHVRDRGARVIFFYDDTFNSSPKRVEAICDLILERKLDIFWRAEVRLDLIDRPLLEKMKKAGLFHISFGVEAGSERVRREIIHKKIEIADFHNLIGWCLELGIIPNVFFIFSHPTETWEEAQESVKIIESYRGKVESSVAILHVYPGTPLEKTAHKIGLLPPDFTWTRKYRKGVITLPTAQGDVPLFLDKLTWAQTSELLFRWSMSGGNVSILRKAFRAIPHIRSFGDLRRYVIMAAVLAKLKVAKAFSKNRGKTTEQVTHGM